MELVALLPLVVGLVLLGWQVVLIGQAAWSVHSAARAAARAQALGGDRLAAARATVPARFDRRLRVSAAEGDSPAVAVRLRVPMVLPGLAAPTLTARSTFAEQS